MLADCVNEVFVPQGVVDELNEYKLPVLIKPCRLSEIGAAYVRGALGRLHQGELEAIVLTQELAADFVVLDDLLARRKAQSLGINVIGTIGMLLLMEKRGSLNAEQTWEKIRQLTELHNMYLSPQLLQHLKAQLLDIH
ncbi:DUF3368 domain-containing protein [Methylomarinum sp. Ch1-1]|uniref:DUF3368 domain-containing protein n=1 Tax=Methylomarinum roseum TaxID=3067653 RepID=A0AAU7NQE2_9GAMM